MTEAQLFREAYFRSRHPAKALLEVANRDSQREAQEKLLRQAAVLGGIQ